MPKRAGYENIPQALKVLKQENSFGFHSFFKITLSYSILFGAGTASSRTAELKAVLGATAFSSRRLVQ